MTTGSNTQARIGRSLKREAKLAGTEAAKIAMAGLDGDVTAQVALVFATAGYDQRAVLHAIGAVVGPDTQVVGCSGEGVITPGESTESKRVVAVMLIASSNLRFDTFLRHDYSEDPTGCGVRLAREIAERERDDAKVLVLLPDGLTGNCSHLLAALSQELPNVPVVGGTAADAMMFETSYQYLGEEVVSGGVSALLISGNADVEISVSHGCAPIGLRRSVTDSEEGWVRTIDGRPAWDVFKEYLDGDPQDLNAEGIVHLCIGEPLDAEKAEGYDRYVIRTPLSHDKESGALFFPGGGLSEGTAIQMTRRDPTAIRRSAEQCAERISRNGNKPALVFQFDCAGRGKILFGSCASEEIVRPLQRAIGDDVPWIGFHTYGEIAPIADKPYYHNYTVALAAIYDR